MTQCKIKPRRPLLSRLSRWCDKTATASLCHQPLSMPYQVEVDGDWRYGTLATNGVLAILWMQELDCPPLSERQAAVVNPLPLCPLLWMHRRPTDTVWQGSALALYKTLKQHDGWCHARIRPVPGRCAWVNVAPEPVAFNEDDLERLLRSPHTVRIDWVQEILTTLTLPADTVQLAVGAIGSNTDPVLFLDTPLLRLRLMASSALLPPPLILPMNYEEDAQPAETKV